MIAQCLCCGHEVLEHLIPVALGLHFAAVIIIARIAAERVKRVRGERDVAGKRRAPRDILDVGVEAAVFVHDNHAGPLDGA